MSHRKYLNRRKKGVMIFSLLVAEDTETGPTSSHSACPSFKLSDACAPLVENRHHLAMDAAELQWKEKAEVNGHIKNRGNHISRWVMGLSSLVSLLWCGSHIRGGTLTLCKVWMNQRTKAMKMIRLHIHIIVNVASLRRHCSPRVIWPFIEKLFHQILCEKATGRFFCNASPLFFKNLTASNEKVITCLGR